MKDLGVELFSLTSDLGPTGKFKQTAAINNELREASKEIYDTIRKNFTDDQDQLGGELTPQHWENLTKGIEDMPIKSEEELSYDLSRQWEVGGLRELVHKLDDTLRAQYFRHEQKLILSDMSKDAFSDASEKYRDGFKVRLDWQKPKQEIINPDLVKQDCNPRHLPPTTRSN